MLCIESSSDNDSEFSDTSSKCIEKEEANGLTYRSKEIPNKCTCSQIVQIRIFSL